ncbi:chemotaxis protein CheD [Mesobacillus selenatarsenatis]|uniref:Probable chemoreceptor glutamine deamidase CheD n=1 Tax=Mesobacillus selenatarsenatis (strain DSM 18680 / JCM 14380 / FERM P-15431 / SF-1) TaxID=1321606 RepID=A0A0A8X976_MESS1|nr:chemotaxis protein CheD [Mesobacillus selenatarsenatis]GAM15582.1 chemotaxis protein CheD [Mesobacillus selenatarsenatis SF-1]
MHKTAEIIKVGIADMNIVKVPDLIRTTGLGSCVGVVLYDQAREIAGMAHIMLPDSSLSRAEPLNKAKFANTAIKELLNALIKIGARPSGIKAKIAGGAQMFQFSGSSDMMRIGPRNVEAVLQELKELRIPIIARDVGGNSGRTIEFDPKNGLMQIRTVNKGNSEI